MDFVTSRRQLLKYALFGVAAPSLLLERAGATTPNDLNEAKTIALANSLIRANRRSIFERTIGESELTKENVALYQQEMRDRFRALSAIRRSNSTAQAIDELVDYSGDLDRDFIGSFLDIVGYRSLQDVAQEDADNDAKIDAGTLVADGGLAGLGIAGFISAPWVAGGVLVVGLTGVYLKSANDTGLELSTHTASLEAIHDAALGSMVGSVRNNILVLYAALKHFNPDEATKYETAIRDFLDNPGSLDEMKEVLDDFEKELIDILERVENGQDEGETKSQIDKSIEASSQKEGKRKLIEDQRKRLIELRESRERGSGVALAGGILELVLNKPGLQEAVTKAYDAITALSNLPASVGPFTVGLASLNGFTAGLAVFNLLLGSKGDPKMAMLQYIAKLIEQLRTEMHARFDQIENRLITLQEGMQRIETLLIDQNAVILANQEAVESRIKEFSEYMRALNSNLYNDFFDLSVAEDRAKFEAMRAAINGGAVSQLDIDRTTDALFSILEKYISASLAYANTGFTAYAAVASSEDAQQFYTSFATPVTHKTRALEEISQNDFRWANLVVANDHFAEFAKTLIEFEDYLVPQDVDKMFDRVFNFLEQQGEMLREALSSTVISEKVDALENAYLLASDRIFGFPTRNEELKVDPTATRLRQSEDSLLGAYQNWYQAKALTRIDRDALPGFLHYFIGGDTFASSYPVIQYSSFRPEWSKYIYGSEDRDYAWRLTVPSQEQAVTKFELADLFHAANGRPLGSGVNPGPGFSLSLIWQFDDAQKDRIRTTRREQAERYDAVRDELGLPPRSWRVRSSSLYNILSAVNSPGVYFLEDPVMGYGGLPRVSRLGMKNVDCAFFEFDPFVMGVYFDVIKMRRSRGYQFTPSGPKQAGWTKSRFVFERDRTPL